MRMNNATGSDLNNRKDKLSDTDYYDMLSKEEKELFESSNFKKVRNWLKSLYGIPAESWMDWKIFDQKRQKSVPAVRRKPVPMPTYKDILKAYAKKREMSELRRLKKYVRTESGNEIIMTKLSRELHPREVALHQSGGCTFIGSCAIFASKNKIYYFSCINCPQAKHLKK
ncbi:MAG: hypothetical protein WC848_02335 [Parcubacteria group bacterium]|jgi:hypothetical protein